MKSSLLRVAFFIVIINFFVFQINLIYSEVSKEERVKKANEFYLSGKYFIEQGNYQAANTAFKKAQSFLEETPLAPKQAPVKLRVSRIDLPRQEDKKILGKNALKGAQTKQIKTNNKKADSYYNKGINFILNEQYPEAADALKKAVELNQQDQDACYNLGVLYENYLDDKREARRYYRKYIRLAPQSQDSARVEGWIKQINNELGEL